MIIPVNNFIFKCCIGVFLIKFLFVSVYSCSNVVLLLLDEMCGGSQCKNKKRGNDHIRLQKCGKYSMYKRCICEISLCIIKFKQFKMMSLFQHNHVIRIYHLQNDESLNWC